jgi:hypothetical protein
MAWFCSGGTCTFTVPIGERRIQPISLTIHNEAYLRIQPISLTIHTEVYLRIQPISLTIHNEAYLLIHTHRHVYKARCLMKLRAGSLCRDSHVTANGDQIRYCGGDVIITVFWDSVLCRLFRVHSFLIQSSTQTHMDLWNSAMGDSLQFQHEILQRFQSKTLRSILNAHKQPQDPWRSANEHSTQWNKKVEFQILKKIIKHTNALAVNLLDNSETTYRLKRYTGLTLPDRPE